jgi:hypothetical protein
VLTATGLVPVAVFFRFGGYLASATGLKQPNRTGLLGHDYLI